jgi:hypothetical protein
MSLKVIAGPRASGCLQSITTNPHEMGSKKGNVKGLRKVRRSQVVEKMWLLSLDSNQEPSG